MFDEEENAINRSIYYFKSTAKRKLAIALVVIVYSVGLKSSKNHA
jgi:hypothetical protein